MSYNIKIDCFEGPLDLLLSLIRDQKLDILDIPIAKITEQYNQIISKWDIFDLKEASEYILMASRLVQIKSRMLLPSSRKDDSEEDPRKELTEQLLEYAAYKEAAGFLEEREKEGLDSFNKDPEYLPELVCELEPKVSVNILKKALKRLLIRQEAENLRPVPIRFDQFDINKQKAYLLKSLANSPELNFDDILSASQCAEEIVVNFLAMLELYKTGHLDFNQDGREIYIRRT